MSLMKRKQDPDPDGEAALSERLRTVARRGRVEGAAYVAAAEPIETLPRVQRRFWSPYELLEQS